MLTASQFFHAFYSTENGCEHWKLWNWFARTSLNRKIYFNSLILLDCELTTLFHLCRAIFHVQRQHQYKKKMLIDTQTNVIIKKLFHFLSKKRICELRLVRSLFHSIDWTSLILLWIFASIKKRTRVTAFYFIHIFNVIKKN